MSKYDVTALGELLIDFTEPVHRGTRFWKQIRAERHATYCPC